MTDSRPSTYAHIDDVQELMFQAVFDLLHRAHVHDRSKLTEPERSVFDEYTPLLNHTTYGSVEYKQYLKEMRPALAHHYRVNRHHPEHFPDGIKGMNLLDIVEMLCDWTAATKRHGDSDIRKSIELNQDRFGYGDELKKILLNTVEALA